MDITNSSSNTSDIKFLVNFLEVMTQASQSTTTAPVTTESMALISELTSPKSALSTFVHRGIDQVMAITNGEVSPSPSDSSATQKRQPSRSASNSHYPNCHYYSSTRPGSVHHSSSSGRSTTSVQKTRETAGERDLRTINDVLRTGTPAKNERVEKGNAKPEAYPPSKLAKKESFTSHVSF
ncbi:hypothetical protein GALMADRAFT_144309 [Galerina marginata CBS 339.88]|uniref:Uncharacterized protein n=1 Tax=Galerina marginata (strain CBS 339.88) TaxID=685588 RepID=A0A067ST05_GALM3|nr:hypothetical protein GALMADRAFT_144309 [Galerina marginata CBS 339.88]